MAVLPRLDPGHVQQVRDRVEQLRDARPSGLTVTGPDGPALQSAMENPEVLRHAGSDRYATAAALVNHWWRDYLWDEDNVPLDYEKVVFVASGTTFADALSGGAAAAAWGGPLLLTKPDRLSAATHKTLTDLKPDAIVLLGGTGAVSTEVETSLQALVPRPDNVHRVTGDNRYEVSANVAAMNGKAPVAVVASGTTFADGLAGGSVAGAQVSPLLLTRPGSAPGPVLAALRDTVRPSQIYVLGGPNAVSDTVIDQLDDLAPVTRIDGPDRYAVAEKVAGLLPTTHGATVASGQDWPDALAGSAFAGVMRDKLLLLKKDAVPLATQRAVHQHGLVYLDALGGPTPLPESVLDTLRSMEIAVAQ
ncbi:cell wall-binding repeat-containing protein [Ornithinimicrobium pekingense]|uniref:Cell wall-binding repeat-containing protein n=1 Tax=Ornithinimicrobium pekingense TaxID=384677 RepID=A0ABQ2F5U8_9MICO|nr:cell wall-binding repeat-containing protein [Ornithinimicrobium pekingense]GGK56020.1 hypothetical protein GCM10011509_00480 [Ornithinimicrobium pekingense]